MKFVKIKGFLLICLTRRETQLWSTTLSKSPWFNSRLCESKWNSQVPTDLPKVLMEVTQMNLLCHETRSKFLLHTLHPWERIQLTEKWTTHRQQFNFWTTPIRGWRSQPIVLRLFWESNAPNLTEITLKDHEAYLQFKGGSLQLTEIRTSQEFAQLRAISKITSLWDQSPRKESKTRN